MENIRAVETKYDGRLFRSRTEARWAVFFKNAGIPYQYEEYCYKLKSGKRYMPDFIINTNKGRVAIEIKGSTVEDVAGCEKAAEFGRELPEGLYGLYIIEGAPKEFRPYELCATSIICSLANCDEELGSIAARTSTEERFESKKPTKAQNKTGALKQVDDGIKKTQALLIGSICRDESLLEQTMKYLKPDDFDGDIYRDITKQLFNGVTPSELMDKYSSDFKKSYEVYSILNYSDGEYTTVLETALASAIVKIKLHSLDKAVRNATDFDYLHEIIREQTVWKNKTIQLKR